MTSTSRLLYDERLTAPRVWWAIAVLFGLSLALIFLPYGIIAALIALSLGTCLAGMYVSAQGSARIRVTGDTLFVMDARIPLTALGQPEVLMRRGGAGVADVQGRSAGVHGDAQLHHHRGARRGSGPRGPHPYLYLSTRTPDRLAEAIGARA